MIKGIEFPSTETNSMSSTFVPDLKLGYLKLYLLGSEPNNIVLAPLLAKLILIKTLEASSSGVGTSSH